MQNMDQIKTKVLKSKSSNATIYAKKQDKKSRSNAEMQPIPLKKRGVYVEKKATKTSMTDDIDNSPKKPKVVPRPGKKRFLDSILTILSKSTTGTQFPDLNEKNNKMKMKRKKLYEQNVIGDLNTVKKPKYRSKVLNEYKDLDLDKVVILQSRKEIIQTPSNNSQRSKDRESIKWSDDIPTVVQNTDSAITVINTEAKDQQLSLIDHIDYRNDDVEKNVTSIGNTDEVITLVNNEQNNEQKDNNKLYNFFVDLLESTFNVYNAETEKTVINNSSKLVLETRDSVANKLNTDNTLDYAHENIHNDYRMNHDFYIGDDWDNTLLDGVKSMSLRDIGPELPLIKPKGRRKLKSESFSYKKKNSTPVTRSFINQYSAAPPKRMLKKDRKKNLLNLLKEQLRIENAYEPPKNFFESLQVMAKYKNHCQKSIHFGESTKKASEASVHDCMYKRRRLFSTASKNSTKSTTAASRSFRSFSHRSTLGNRSKSRVDYRVDNDSGSRLSLAVYTYDVEPNVNVDKQPKRDVYEPTVSAVSSGSSVFDSVIEDEYFSQW